MRYPGTVKGHMLIALAVSLLAATVAADQEVVRLWDNPRRLSFEFTKTPLSNVTAVICRRFGEGRVSIEDRRRRVDFVETNLTFFEALDRLAEQNGMVLLGSPGRAPSDRGKGEQALHIGKAAGRSAVARLGSSRLSASAWVLGDGGMVDLDWFVPSGLERAAILKVDIKRATDDTKAKVRVSRGLPPHVMNANERKTLLFDKCSPKATMLMLEGTIRIGLPLETSHVDLAVRDAGKLTPLGACWITLDGITKSAEMTVTVVGNPLVKRDAQLPQLQIKSGSSRVRTPINMIETVLGGNVRPAGELRLSHYGAGVRHRIALSAVPYKVTFRAVTRIATRDLPFTLNVPLLRMPQKTEKAED